ncbi:hypothetical protein EGW08_012389 [Elysia chlorotica]|uniref:N-alpha-acetyltransferase 60 n=1 Tax=Elysia chlorotica TaxID=188477 RepID=A0A3S1HI47_ELYCH|nr:hypothetical protein EGW08_012389 [Elysia chlorotica]
MEMQPPLSALRIQQEVQLRFLSPSDIEEVKTLCRDWFPIEYPDYWYTDITSSPRFYSLAATHYSRIIGLVVAELRCQEKLNKEDSDLLANQFPPNTQVAYILSLGVVGDFRRNGIASLLLDSLLSYLTAKERSNCKAVYLHVLSTNTVALRFYERRKFRRHLFLPYYYAIGGKARDGYSYVLYINGGQPPWSLLDYLPQCGKMLRKLQPCALPRQVYNAVRNLFLRLLSRSASEASLKILSTGTT